MFHVTSPGFELTTFMSGMMSERIAVVKIPYMVRRSPVIILRLNWGGAFTLTGA